MEKYLNKCLDSLIIAPEYMKQLEVWIVNDGSRDCSSEIAHSYSNKYPETFFVIDKENGNYGSCINAALKCITGKYVKILDADDYFDNSSFGQYLSFLNETDADLVLTDHDIIDENDNVTRERRIGFPQHKLMMFLDICESSEFNHVSMHSVTYKSCIFRQIKYEQTEGVFYTDQEWIFEPMTQIKTVVNSGITLYKYLVGRTGQSVDVAQRMKSISHSITVILSRARIFHRYENSHNSLKSYLLRRLLYSMNHVYMNGLVNKLLPKDVIEEFDSKLKQISRVVYDYAVCFQGIRMFPYIMAVRTWRRIGYCGIWTLFCR